MRRILDLHLHSKFARACSPRLTLSNMAMAAERKGVDIIACGDFTHPAWFKAITTELVEVGKSGLYQLKDNSSKTLFILSTEVSLVYKDGGKARRIHLVVLAPNLVAVTKLNKYLGTKYNIHADGRPILGISAPKFVRLCLYIDANFLIYPAHIWTPWYAVFGSKSGFNSLEECFQEETKNIYAYETGLSSDPSMNWRLSALDNLTCLSNSDAHSLDNIGREANVMSLFKDSYDSIYQVIKNNLRSSDLDREGMLETIEFYPEEGLYHLDGHRLCSFSCQPEISSSLKNICPVCDRPLVIGVLNRVNDLADRPLGFHPDRAVPFRHLVELDKIIAESLNLKNRQAKKVVAIYDELIKTLGPELSILMDADIIRIQALNYLVALGVERMRAGKLKIEPGFDGQYGRVTVFCEADFKTAQLL